VAESDKGTSLEFTADGKFTARAKKGDSEQSISGTFTIDGKSLKFTTSKGTTEFSLEEYSATKLVTINDQKTRTVWVKADATADGVDKAKLVGVWVAEGSKGINKGSILVFTADGKVTVTVKMDKGSTVLKGTYTIEGQNVKTVWPATDKEPARTDIFAVEKLTAKELVTIDDQKNRDVFVKQDKVEISVEVDTTKLIGVWELNSAKGSTIEFHANGKITAKVKKDNEVASIEGTYTAEGTLVKLATAQGKSSFIIETLTAKELVTIDEKKTRETWTRVDGAATQDGLTKEEQKVLDLTNAERKKAGLEPLKVNAKLMALARDHSKNMAKQNKLDHTLDNKTPSQRMTDAGYNWSASAENIYWNATTPEQAVEGWMNSSGHKANILGKYTEIGIGLAKSDKGEPYWTQVFGTPR